MQEKTRASSKRERAQRLQTCGDECHELARTLTAEAVELETAAKPEPRPYYYGQPILVQQAGGDLTPERRSAVIEFNGDVTTVAVDVGELYSGTCAKHVCTHLDGAPLGEFLMLPSNDAEEYWPNSICSLHDTIRDAINRSLLKWRDDL